MTTAHAIDLATFLPRLGIDLAALMALSYGLYYRRHGRRDMVVTFSMFNVGLFLAAIVLARGGVGASVGFGLFAVLSIVRLRSEPFSNTELGYLFIALIMALLTAVSPGGLEFAVLASSVALGAAAFIDHPRLLPQTRRLELTLELVFVDEDALRRHVQERLNADVVELTVLEIDFVREITRVVVRSVDRPTAPRNPENRYEPLPAA